MTGRQQEFDFTWARKCALVRMAYMESVVLPDGKPVSSAAMKAVLTAIHSHAGEAGECWSTAETLAIEISRSDRTVRRALAGLRSYGLLIERTVQHGAHTQVHRRICFSNLIDHEVVRAPVTRKLMTRHPETNRSHPETNNTTPGNQCPPKKQKKQEEESKKSEVGFLESDIAETAAPAGAGRSTNSQELVIEDLIEPTSLERMFQELVARGVLKDCEAARLALFGFGKRCHRKRGELKHAVGFFVHGSAKGFGWLSGQVDDATDRAFAIRAVKQLRGDVLTRSSDLARSPGEREARAMQDFEAERSRQQAALQAAFGGGR